MNPYIKFSSMKSFYRIVDLAKWDYKIEFYPPSLIVTPQSPCRALQAWCGEDGRKLFQDELSKALDTLVDHTLPKAEAK